MVRGANDNTAVKTPDNLDQSLSLENPQSFPQGRAGNSEPLDQLRLTTQPVALDQLPADDEGPQFVGDLLRLLALSRDWPA